MTDDDGDIFEGVIIHTLPLPGRHLYANHDQIAVRVRRADGSQATLQVRLGEWRG